MRLGSDRWAMLSSEQECGQQANCAGELLEGAADSGSRPATGKGAKGKIHDRHFNSLNRRFSEWEGWEDGSKRWPTVPKVYAFRPCRTNQANKSCFRITGTSGKVVGRPLSAKSFLGQTDSGVTKHFGQASWVVIGLLCCQFSCIGTCSVRRYLTWPVRSKMGHFV